MIDLIMSLNAWLDANFINTWVQLIFVISFVAISIIKLIKKLFKHKMKNLKNHDIYDIFTEYHLRINQSENLDPKRKVIMRNYLNITSDRVNEIIQRYYRLKMNRKEDLDELFSSFFYKVSKDLEHRLLDLGKSKSEFEMATRCLDDIGDVMKNEINNICHSDIYKSNDAKMPVLLDVVMTVTLMFVNKI